MPGGLVYDYQTDSPLVAVIYCLEVLFGGRGLTDRSSARVGGEIAGKQHAPTAGISSEHSERDRDASALPEVQHMKWMLLSR